MPYRLLPERGKHFEVEVGSSGKEPITLNDQTGKVDNEGEWTGEPEERHNKEGAANGTIRDETKPQHSPLPLAKRSARIPFGKKSY